MMRYLIFILLIGAFAACGGNADSKKEAAQQEAIKKQQEKLKEQAEISATWDTLPYEELTWELATFIIDGKEALVNSDQQLTIKFSSGRFYGNSGCNDFFGTYKHNGANGIEVARVGATRKSCKGSIVGIERRMHRTVEAATVVEHEKGRLVLKADGDGLIFKPI
ncbi:MAG: META domain-containing protein [Bacteroidota bacterium]